MKDFFKYLIANEEDRQWGIFINVAGISRISRNAKYPSPDHPAGYFFSWENGRVLAEYQLNYISEGAGILETKNGKFKIKAGTLMIIKPGMWHRYKPDVKSGWVEHYVGFVGEIADRFMNHTFLNPKKPLIYIGNKEEFIDCYYKVFDLVKKEKPGFQQVASAMIVKLLGNAISFQKQKEFSNDRPRAIIDEVRFLIRQNIAGNYDFRAIAIQQCLSYSYFRKMFKKYTGVSPGQYHLQLKIMKAKELLLNSNLSIKELSCDLGFQSIYYFSRIFKQKTGCSPSLFRQKAII